MFLGLFLLLTHCSFAAEPEIHIDSYDHRLKPEAFQGPSTKATFSQRGKQNSEMNVPSSKDTEAFLVQAQLSDEVRSWDQLAKDVLIIKARKLDVNSLASEYPSIQKAKLAHLKGFLK